MQWENCVLIDLRVAGWNQAGQLLIYSHIVSPGLTKTLCQHASLVPWSCIKAFMCKPRHCSLWLLAPLTLPGFLLQGRIQQAA